MQRLSFILIFVLWVSAAFAQNPHGEKLTIDCKACHNSGSWLYKANDTLFDHDDTGFALEGQHVSTDCNDCHNTLVFDQAENTCVSCHTDVHSMSVGDDCIRCHDASNWLVDEIPELHEQNGFPLVGQHQVVSCSDCHVSETNLRWDRIGTDCATCHLDDYTSSQNPNHMEAGFSTTCTDCHDVFANSWGAENFHFFFPLTGGHEIADCAACHEGTNYSAASPDCVTCHLDDFNAVTTPNHVTSGFSQDCTTCHDIAAWSPADFRAHDDEYFPIYSGKHAGEWNSCVECHTTPGNYTSFSCVDCHEHDNPTELAKEHDDIRDYVYESNACYSCHPNGDED